MFDTGNPHFNTLFKWAALTSAVCFCSSMQTRLPKTASAAPTSPSALVHTLCSRVELEKATEIQFRVRSRPRLCFSPDNGLYCTTLLAMAALTCAVCCCSATRTRARRPTSDAASIHCDCNVANVCACLHVCFAVNAPHCITLLGAATLKPAVCWSSLKPMSPS